MQVCFRKRLPKVDKDICLELFNVQELRRRVEIIDNQYNSLQSQLKDLMIKRKFLLEDISNTEKKLLQLFADKLERDTVSYNKKKRLIAPLIIN